MAHREERRRTPRLEKVPLAETPDDALHSWREIAAYLGKGVRSVQRWESALGLPVHRNERSEILAYRSELDAWAHRALSAPDQMQGNATRPTTTEEQRLRSVRLRQATVNNIAAARETFEKTKKICAAIILNRTERCG